MDMVVRLSASEQALEGRRACRTSGWAAIVAALAFLVQPVSVAVLPFDLETVDDPVELSRYWWAGTLQAAEFAVIAVAVLTLVVGLRTIWSRSIAGQVTWACGLVSAAAFLLQAALSAATYSSWLMADAATVTPDPQARSAILFGTYVVGYAFLGTANLAGAIWVVGLAGSARDGRVVGRVFTAFLALVALVLVVGTLTGFTIPTVIVHVPLWLALGIRLLRGTSRHGAAPAE